MKDTRPAPAPASDAGREAGPMLASRLVAVLRTGRSYAIENPVFTSQLEQLLEVLAPVLRDVGEARLTVVDGELCYNGDPVSPRLANARHAEQLVNEFEMREIVGVRFLDGLTLPELEMFMRYFVPSEVHRGTGLERACAIQGVSHALPLVAIDEPAAGPTAAPVAAEATPATYLRGVEAVTRALHDAHALMGRGLPRGVETHHYKRIVQPVVDAALAHEAVSAGLADLDEGGVGPWVHGVRAALLAVGVGHQLHLDRNALAELGVAALLHGTGTSDLPRDGRAAVRVPARRVALARLTARTSLDQATLVAIGLPFEWGAAAASRTAAGQVAAVADMYVRLASERANGALRRTPYEALGLLLGPLAGEYHVAVRAALVGALGVFPPGQIVELDDGAVARVCAADPADPERPFIECMTGPAGSRAPAAERGRIVTLPAGRSIARAVPFARTGTRAA